MESSTDRELSVPVRRRSLAKEEPPTEGFSSAMCFLIVCGLTAILVCYFSQPVAHVPAHPELPSPKSSAYRKNMTPPPKANESITLSQSQSKSISAAPPMATATDDDSDSDNQNAAAHPLSTSGSQEPTPKHSSKKKPSASSSVPPSHTLCLAVRDKLPSLQWDNTDILPPPPTWQISVPAGSDDRVAVPTNCIAQDTLMKDHACWNLLDAKDPNLLDMWLLFNVFRLPWLQTRGHFVEYGAKDGVFGSLSYFFETRLNWTGFKLPISLFPLCFPEASSPFLLMSPLFKVSALSHHPPHASALLKTDLTAPRCVRMALRQQQTLPLQPEAREPRMH
eukprot:c10672_g1_i1.p1 GENE.c10672_g1_i1~~c10672_g1_i1.p1  ORF type:complete len:336 (-),score=54.04 c10672_g1_i1:521-1528(-)